MKDILQASQLGLSDSRGSLKDQISNDDEVSQALNSGDQHVQDQTLRLIKALFDPSISFFVGTNTNMPTLTQMQFLQATLPAIAGFSRAIVVRRDFGVTPIQSLRNIPVGFQYFSNTGGLTFGGTGSAPTLTWFQEHFVPEVGTPLTLSPQMTSSFSIGRINSYVFAVQSAQNTLANQYTTGSIAFGEVGDNRDVTSLKPTDLAMQSVVQKNGNSHVDAWEGCCVMGTPGFSPMLPVDMHLVAGNGLAAYTQNVLSATVPFFNQSSTVWWRTAAGASNNYNGFAGSYQTDAVNTNALVWANSICISPYFSMTCGSNTVTNISIAPIAQDTLPSFDITVRVPASFGQPGLPDATGAPAVNTAGNAQVSPYSITVYQLYAQANGAATNILFDRQSYPIAPQNVNPTDKFISIPQAFTGTSVAGVSTLAITPAVADNLWYGQNATVIVSMTAQYKPGYYWVGCIVQGCDGTQYPWYPPTVGAYNGSTTGGPDPDSYIGVPTIAHVLDQTSTTPNRTTPWFYMLDQTKLSTMAPQINAIKVIVPRMYDQGQLGPYQAVRIDGLSASQQITISGKVMAELVGTGTTAQFKKSDADLTVTDDNVTILCKLLFDMPSTSLKSIYRMSEWEKVRVFVDNMTDAREILAIPGLKLTPKVVQVAKAAGFFGDFVDRGVQAIQDIPAVASEVWRELKPIAMEALRVGATEAAKAAVHKAIGANARYAVEKRSRQVEVIDSDDDDDSGDAGGMFGSGGMYGADGSAGGMFGSGGMFGADSAGGMFGVQRAVTDGCYGGEAKASFTTKLNRKSGVTNYVTIGGRNGNLPSGMLMSFSFLLTVLKQYASRIPDEAARVSALRALNTHAIAAVDADNEVFSYFAASDVFELMLACGVPQEVVSSITEQIMLITSGDEMRQYAGTLVKDGYITQSEADKLTLNFTLPGQADNTNKQKLYDLSGSRGRAVAFVYYGIVGIKLQSEVRGTQRVYWFVPWTAEDQQQSVVNARDAAKAKRLAAKTNIFSQAEKSARRANLATHRGAMYRAQQGQFEDEGEPAPTQPQRQASASQAATRAASVMQPGTRMQSVAPASAAMSMKPFASQRPSVSFRPA